MSYYKLLGLDKEPFSTSPDPTFFYQSNEHKAALYRLRIAIELKRGLSLILGDVGTGKTTLSRRMAQLFKMELSVSMAMILNPIYESEKQFLADLAERFHISVETPDGEEPKTMDYMKSIERFLFEKSVEEDVTVTLLIDEAQKLSEPCLEILRSLLNYETNEYKILQVVLMGQMELLPKVSKIRNLWDRIALKYVINPLEENETKELINFRLRRAGYISRYPLFSDAAINAIYNYTQGYPRKITIICHDALAHLIMQKKEIIDKGLIQELIQKDVKPVGV